jgi:ribonuclease HI
VPGAAPYAGPRRKGGARRRVKKITGPRHILYTDGASLGNPGHGAGGAILIDPDGGVVARLGGYLGLVTSNEAESGGLHIGVARAIEEGAKALEIRMDSQLMARQLQGAYAVNAENLVALYDKALGLLDTLDSWSADHVPRAQTAAADRRAGTAASLGTAGGLGPGELITEPAPGPGGRAGSPSD